MCRELQEKVEKLNEGIKRTVALKYALTNREKEVLQLVVDGLNSEEIARNLVSFF
jgi:DNA-binding CsgD family transcriptional regulator